MWKKLVFYVPIVLRVLLYFVEHFAEIAKPGDNSNFLSE